MDVGIFLYLSLVLGEAKIDYYLKVGIIKIWRADVAQLVEQVFRKH